MYSKRTIVALECGIVNCSFPDISSKLFPCLTFSFISSVLRVNASEIQYSPGSSFFIKVNKLKDLFAFIHHVSART